jgi:hypothetical protein
MQKGFLKFLVFLLYRYLLRLQRKYSIPRTIAAVDAAIAQYEQVEETPPSPTEGVFSSTGDDFFDEIRIQARYTLTPNNINDDGTNP